MYAIVDVETSGTSADNCKITDIAVIIHDGVKEVDRFHSLVNPERKISRRVTQLTGIDNELVRNAPKFYEIAKKVFTMTQDMVFVAHNVSFDYRVLRKEFEELGGEFVRKQLCTIRTARRLIPGSQSYALGRLCADLGIPITQRHRALGDAEATVKLFEMLLDKSSASGQGLWPSRKKERRIAVPGHLSATIYDHLPTQTGVYYFHDKAGQVIYVGKAKNIRQRVLSHFHDKSRKEMQMCQHTESISHEVTGSELVALLMESAEIKTLFPQYNHSQKRLVEKYGLFCYQNKGGVFELRADQLEDQTQAVVSFYTKGHADRFMHKFVGQRALCHRYTGLEKTKSGCFASRLEQCRGVCCNQEEVSAYNDRVQKALDSLKINAREILIVEKGRSDVEHAIVHIDTTGYQGYGFIRTDDRVYTFDQALEYINPQHDTSDAQRIIRNYIHNSPNIKVIEKKSKTVQFT